MLAETIAILARASHILFLYDMSAKPYKERNPDVVDIRFLTRSLERRSIFSFRTRATSLAHKLAFQDPHCVSLFWTELRKVSKLCDWNKRRRGEV